MVESALGSSALQKIALTPAKIRLLLDPAPAPRPLADMAVGFSDYSALAIAGSDMMTSAAWLASENIRNFWNDCITLSRDP